MTFEHSIRNPTTPNGTDDVNYDLSWPGDGSLRVEESPDFAERDALGNGGRGDPTESATETKPPRLAEVRVKR